MDFGWIKKLFKNKTDINSNSLGISTIDTSFIKVPKLSDLSKENQNKVMKYFNEINYNNYETIVKYGDSLLEKSNKEIEFFVHDLEDIIKDISTIIKDINEENYYKLLLYKEEIKLSIEELNKIEKEAELRLIALDMYIKKEERRKYDFLGIFGKAERLRYLKDKSSLLNERQRLLITIKLNKQHLQIIYNSLNENKGLLETMNNYLKSNDSFMNLSEKYYLRTCIAIIYEKEQLIGDKFISKELESMVYYLKPIYSVRGVKETIGSLSKNGSIITLVSKEIRKINKYAYEHRNDYSILINKMNIISCKYDNLPSSKWNIKELTQEINKYTKLTSSYIIICKRYINDDVLKQIRDSLFNLNYYYYISNYVEKNKIDGIEHTLFDKRIINNEGRYRIYYNDPRDDSWHWAKNYEEEFYDKLSLNLLNKIEYKYDITLKTGLYGLISNISKLDILKIIKKNGELQYLFDILHGNFEIFDMQISFNNEIKINDFIKKIASKKIEKGSYTIQNVSTISINDLFNLLIFLGKHNYNINNLFVKCKQLEDRHTVDEGLLSDNKININTMLLREFLGQIYTQKLKKEYDNRILIIPSIVEFNSLMEYGNKKILQSIDNELNISNNTIGIYVSNWSQANIISKALELKSLSIKYLFMNEYLYNELTKIYNKINAKLIIVPDDVKYSELSSYLDKEIDSNKRYTKYLKI